MIEWSYPQVTNLEKHEHLAMMSKLCLFYYYYSYVYRLSLLLFNNIIVIVIVVNTNFIKW